MKELVIYSNTDFFKYVLNYICEKYSDQVNRFQYLSEHVTKRYEYRRKNIQTFKTCVPCDTNFELNFKEKKINFTLETVKKDNGDLQKMIQQTDICMNGIEEILLQEITLKGETKDLLIDFVDVAKKYCEEQIKSSQKSSRRQDLEAAYFPYGVFYGVKVSSFLKNHTFYQDRLGYFLIDEWQNYEIDNAVDFEVCQAIARLKGMKIL